MSRIEYYRAEANRCHMAAVTCRDPEEASRWRDLSQGYQDIAVLFESLHRLARGETTTSHRTPAAVAPGAIASGARAIADPQLRRVG